jgi:hypothetical protein
VVVKKMPGIKTFFLAACLAASPPALCQERRLAEKAADTVVRLPAGWYAKELPQDGVTTFGLRGSTDTVMAGAFAFPDARRVVTMLAEQVTPTFALEKLSPIRTLADGTLRGGSSLAAADGRWQQKIILARPLANRKTALVALYTADRHGQPGLKNKLRDLDSVMAQLKAGRVIAATAVPAGNQKK